MAEGARVLGFVPLGLVPLFVLLIGVCGFRGPVRWELPPNYRGWVHVVFEQPDCLALQLSGFTLIVPVDERGCGCSSSPTPWKAMRWHEYSYVLEDGTRIFLDQDDMVRGVHPGTAGRPATYDASGRLQEAGRSIPFAEFFVGTSEEAAAGRRNRYNHEQLCDRFP